jgi:hypothetical protein
MEEKTCRCGRIWNLEDQEWIERDPGAIVCKCGETLIKWTGSRTWSATLVKGLPQDEGNPKPCTYE